MENDYNEIEPDGDAIDREVRKLIQDVEERETYKRALIELLVMLGSDVDV